MRGAVALAVGLTFGVCAPASARPVTVAMFGDSVTEGTTIAHPFTRSLVPDLVTDLSARGFADGGVGFIPADPMRWRFNDVTSAGSTPPLGGWLQTGFSIEPGIAGPSGYAAIATDPGALATVSVHARRITILYTAGSGAGAFTMGVPTQSWTVEPATEGPPMPASQTVTLPVGERILTVHGPQTGQLVLSGVVEQVPHPPRARTTVEVDNLGHFGHGPGTDLTPQVEESIALERYDIAVFLWYTNDFQWAGGIPAGGVASYAAMLRTRARIAHKHGGRCVLLTPTPAPLPASLLSKFSAVDRAVARKVGCVYSGALAHLWNPADAQAQGLTQLDDIHPSARGYRLMARTLARVLTPLIREAARRRPA